MKKQFLLAVLLVLAGLLYSNIENNNSLKACDANKPVPVVGTAKGGGCKKMPVLDVQDMDLMFDPFMNPFINL